MAVNTPPSLLLCVYVVSMCVQNMYVRWIFVNAWKSRGLTVIGIAEWGFLFSFILSVRISYLTENLNLFYASTQQLCILCRFFRGGYVWCSIHIRFSLKHLKGRNGRENIFEIAKLRTSDSTSSCSSNKNLQTPETKVPNASDEIFFHFVTSLTFKY